MVVSSPESIRIRVDPPLKGPWEKMLEEHRITQQAAITSVMEWLISEDPLTRAMIFKQVPVKDRLELSRIVLRRLGGGKGKGAK